MRILRWIGLTFAALIVAVALFLFAARFSDGPIEIIAGGPFTTGEMQSGPEPDWSFLRDKQTVQFQLMDPDRSRTTWIVEHEGKIFIPSGYMNSIQGKIWKQWPIEAEKDGRAILRVDGKLYERNLIRIKDGPDVAPVMKLLAEKYNFSTEGGVESVSSNDTWLFQVAPR